MMNIPSNWKVWLSVGLPFLLLTACDRKVEATLESPSSPEVISSLVKPPEESLELETTNQRASYGLGYKIGKSLSQDESIQVDQASLLSGLKDGLSGQVGQLTAAEIRESGKEIEAREASKIDAFTKGKQAEAIEFLKKNAQRPGVEVTPSGLQYSITTPASDPSSPIPSMKDRVRVHYHGTLLSGAVFDSSVKRGEAIEFSVAGVMPGWIEALKTMRAGEKRKLFLPPALGYGSKGAGSVPPHSVLVFDFELLGISEATGLKAGE